MTALVSKLRNEIEQNGGIPFARFMELALYSPGEGYYERTQQIGRRGDFFTSVSVGNLFGELLAFQLAEWFENEAKPDSIKLQIIEAGAHDGRLASDILNWFQKQSQQIFQKLEYCILEPSTLRRSWQKETLQRFQNVKWAGDFSELAGDKSEIFRIIISNELFDSMPVHRVGWDAQIKSWFEWGVNFDGTQFVWKRLLENQNERISFPKIAPELMDILPNGFTTEICPVATDWYAQAAHSLDAGKMVTIDYGLLDEEFFVPARSHGTLRAFHRHHANAELLARPGEQDITSQVNFSALQNAGEMTGLKTEALISQTKFLTSIAGQMWTKPNGFGEWDASRRRQFQTLTHPEHLGRSFRVLVQSS